MIKVLLVDDNPHDLTRLEYQLSSLPTKTYLLAVTDPIEAIMRMRKGKFSMLFTNYRMAVMDGLSLVRIANKVAPDMSVNILANQADSIYIKSQSVYAKCSNVILKPGDINELKHIIDQHHYFMKLSEENMKLSARIIALEKHSGLNLKQA